MKIRIRKQPPNYQWYQWPEGELEDHVKAHRSRYLSAIYGLIYPWAVRGRPSGSGTTNFRFRQWERACTGIMETHFPDIPLLDNTHQEEQNRLADPDYDLLRNLFRTVVENEIRSELTATQLGEIAVNADLISAKPDPKFRIGKAMGRFFPADESFGFAAGHFTITRQTRKNESGSHDIKFYTISVSKV